MKKFYHFSLVAIFILAVALSGCGGGNSGGNPGGGNPDGGNPGDGNPDSGNPNPLTPKMISVSGGLTFPTDNDAAIMVNSDNGETSSSSISPGTKGSSSITIRVPHAYEIAQTDVTYQQWSTVYNWATDSARGANKYTFANPGGRGGYWDGSKITTYSSGHDTDPVTTISWRDAMIWCNALTEYYNSKNGTNYACVYCTDSGYTTPIRKVDGEANTDKIAGHEDKPYVNPNAKGFRLPTNNEWELAARYKDGTNWTPGNYASGATDSSETATAAVAVYGNPSGTAVVKSKAANALGLYDMSGNVWQWCFDWYPDESDSHRVTRGGGWGVDASGVQIGKMNGETPAHASSVIGFRPVRTQ